MAENLAERVFEHRISVIELEYSGKLHKLINVCSDSRFSEAKKELIEKVGQVRANELLHQYFNQGV